MIEHSIWKFFQKPFSSSVQFSHSVVSDSLRPHGLQHARPPCPSPTPGAHSDSCTESVMPSNHLILCRPLLLSPSIFPSIRVFSNESVLCLRCPKYCSFSFSISPSNEYSGLVFFRIDWFDLLASDRVWFTGEGNDKLLQYPCLRNPMNSMKRQKMKYCSALKR